MRPIFNKYNLINLFAILCICAFAFSAEAKNIEGALQKEDFGYKGIYLLDSSEKLKDFPEKFLWDNDMVYDEIRVKKYTYDNDVTVYVSEADQKIIEIALSGKKYALRNDVKYGTMKALLLKTYGKSKHMKIHGSTCYVYESSEFPGLHLVLEMDSEYFYVTGVRITSLPVEEDRTFSDYIPEAEDLDDWDKFYHGVRYRFGADFSGNKEI